MYTPDVQGNRPAAARKHSIGRTIGGVALMLIGVGLMAYGAHYLTMNGTCSSTGYASFGPVPKCSGNEFLYITSAFFLGPAVAGVGWLMAGISGLLWPTLCLGLAVSFITLRDDVSAPAGEKAFGLLTGICFVALALVSVVVTLRKRLRKKNAPAGPPAVTAPVLSPVVNPVVNSSFSMPTTSAPSFGGARVAPTVTGSDPLEKIARLAQLRDTGALTDAEFDREKAKLLAEM